jgi:hypothetical protein
MSKIESFVLITPFTIGPIIFFCDDVVMFTIALCQNVEAARSNELKHESNGLRVESHEEASEF